MALAAHLFPGSNTAHGFVGFFEALRGLAKRTVILKGGPGVGKSTLMRDVGKRYEQLGVEVQYFHCSGDPDSLDAVFAPEIGFLTLDGTAPHIVDPALPGAADGILNLGECLDEKALAEQKEEIRLLCREISACYARAYRYLNGALAVRSDAAAVFDAAMPDRERRLLQKELTALIPPGAPGMDTHAFAQAITWKGVIQYVDTLLTDNVCCLDVPWGFDADSLLLPVWEAAGRRGIQRSAFHDPLDAGRLAHVRAGRAAFTTAVLMDARVFSPQMDAGALRRESGRLAFDRAVCQLLENQAMEALAQAKERHDELERYYVDAMDYGRLNEMRRAFLKSLP